MILNRIRREYRDKNIDAIVLGCTHYPFIKDEIQKKFPKAVLMDSARGVARAVSRQLRENGLMVDEKEKGTLEVTFTRKKAA
jgi:glutamate racemase